MSDSAQRAAKTDGAKPTPSDDYIEAQMREIREELAAMTNVMSAFVGDKVHAFGAAAETAAKDASARARKARERAEHGVEKAEKALDDRVQDHPLQSILMAFGLGLLVSQLLRR